jgi:hypothetical protein
MPGMRDRNLRSGDLAESLGIFLLKAIALVAPVPREEDGGNDAIATLIRPEGSRRLIPELSFFVQLKSASVASVPYSGEAEMAWITALEIPLFIGRVDLKQAKIELFTTLRLHQILLEMNYDAIELLLDPEQEPPGVPELRRANLGPPIHTWSVADVSDPALQERSHAVLRPHIEVLQRNRLLRGIQSQVMIQRETGKLPVGGGEMTFVAADSDIASTLNEMAPHTRRLMMEVLLRQKYADFRILAEFFDLMRRWGVDPDPTAAMRMMVGSQAQGPELTVEQAILLRHACQPKGLNLRGLQVTDELLAVIPAGVSQLALVDTLITDEGIEQLLRLQNLSRVNLAGTRIADTGLEMLATLPHLEWVCVNRTEVTAEGVDRFKAMRPGVTVIIGSEP